MIQYDLLIIWYCIIFGGHSV